MKHTCVSVVGVAVLGGMLASSAWGGPISITITNLTRAQTLTPPILVSHKAGVRIFELGTPASLELEKIAEAGNTDLLAQSLESSHAVRDIIQTNNPIEPGRSATYTVDVQFSTKPDKRFNLISLVSKLTPTNDTFVVLNGAPAQHDQPTTLFLSAYDAGTEINDEKCANILSGGGCVDGTGFAADRVGAEGVVYVGNGIRGVGDLNSALYDWKNPVAQVVLEP